MQGLDEWELGFLEALTKHEVQAGAVGAMTTRPGLALEMEEATRATAAYKGHCHLQPDFIAAVFRLMPSMATNESTAARGPGATPGQPHLTVLEWARGVAGPYAALVGRSTYAQDLDKWEVDFEEFLMEIEATTQQLGALVVAAGLDLDSTSAIRALGAYTARKCLRPNLHELRFMGILTTDAAGPTMGDNATNQSPMREFVALLSAQKLEVEQMRQTLIAPLTRAAVDRFLTQALPYASMTSLAACVKELSHEDPSDSFAKQPLPSTVWRVLNEELRAKRQGRPSAPALIAHPGPPTHGTLAAPDDGDRIGHHMLQLPRAGEHRARVPLEGTGGPSSANGAPHPVGKSQPRLRYERTTASPLQQVRTDALGLVPVPPTPVKGSHHPHRTPALHLKHTWDRLECDVAASPLATPRGATTLGLNRHLPSPPTPHSASPSTSA